MSTPWIIFILSTITHFIVSAGIVLTFYMLSQSHEQKMKTHLQNHHQTMDYELQQIKYKLERVINDSAIDRD